MSHSSQLDSHALLIGIANYNEFSRLSKTLNDVQDIASVLRDPNFCGYPTGQVVSLLDDHATREGVNKALAELAQRTGPQSTVVIHYAGHGLKIESGPHKGAYLLPVDAVRSADPVKVAGSAISGEQFAELLQQIPAKKLLVILDCCHAQGVGLLRGGNSDAEMDDVTRGVDGSVLRGGVTDELLSGLAGGEGRVVLSAASLAQGAIERYVDRNGLFTKHVLAGLRGLAPGNDTFIKVFDLFTYVSEQVRRESAEKQTPVFRGEVKDNFPVALRLGGRGASLPVSSGLVQVVAAPSLSPVPTVLAARSEKDLFKIVSRLSLGQREQLVTELELDRSVLSPLATAEGAKFASEVLQIMKQPRRSLPKLDQALREIEVI